MPYSRKKWESLLFLHVISKIAAALARHTHALVPPIHYTTTCDNIVRLFELAA